MTDTHCTHFLKIQKKIWGEKKICEFFFFFRKCIHFCPACIFNSSVLRYKYLLALKNNLESYQYIMDSIQQLKAMH